MASNGAIRLARHLERKQLSLSEFAGQVGSNSKSLVWSWASGKKVPRIDYLLKIEKATGIPPAAWTRPAR